MSQGESFMLATSGKGLRSLSNDMKLLLKIAELEIKSVCALKKIEVGPYH